jgi:hypothetical protein
LEWSGTTILIGTVANNSVDAIVSVSGERTLKADTLMEKFPIGREVGSVPGTRHTNRGMLRGTNVEVTTFLYDVVYDIRRARRPCPSVIDAPCVERPVSTVARESVGSRI